MDVKYFVSDQIQMHNIALSWYFNIYFTHFSYFFH